MTAAETEQTPLLTNAFRSSRLGSGEATEPDRVVDVIASVARALGALKAGKLPSTRQIDDAAVTALQSEVLLAPRPPLLQGRLSTPTYHLLEHLRTSLEASRQLLKRKNATDQLQNLIFASQHLATVSSLQLESASDSSASTSQDLALSLLACQTLLWFILRSFLQESQALLSDILWALRTILADTVENASLRVEKAAQSIRPEDVTQQSQSQARQTLDSLQQRAQHQWDHEVQDRILFRLGKVRKHQRLRLCLALMRFSGF